MLFVGFARFLYSLASATYDNCCSTILPNNGSGHYKKASMVALQTILANLGCVLSRYRILTSPTVHLFV